DSRSSSSTSSGASPSSSSLTELWWISRSRARLFSSSGAARTSSSSCRVMLPIRITLAGCSTISMTGRSPPLSPSPPSPSTAMPSGPTTTTLGPWLASGLRSLMSLVLRLAGSGRTRGAFCPSVGQQDLPDVRARLDQPVRLRRLGHRQHLPHDRGDLPRADQRPHMLPGGRDHLGFLLGWPGPQRGREDAAPLR